MRGIVSITTIGMFQSTKFLDRDPDLYTVSSDRALKITDVETSKSFFEVDKAHKYVITSILPTGWSLKFSM